jgi:hypothetical protein
MKLAGELPVPRMTAVITRGAVSNRVRILGPRGGGNSHSRDPGPVKRKPGQWKRSATGKRAK